MDGTVMQDAAALAVRGLDFWYGANHALKGISMDFPARRVTGMIGPSGCGNRRCCGC
jgi:phosphate transport system ATP-binding protein